MDKVALCKTSNVHGVVLVIYYERICLTASIKLKKKVCAYEKMYTYEEGTLKNPSLNILRVIYLYKV